MPENCSSANVFLVWTSGSDGDSWKYWSFFYLLWSNYNEIIAYVLPSQIGIILTLSYISFIIVFGCYFVSTYYLFQRNIEKH